MKAKLRRTLLASALTLAALPAFAQSARAPFSQTVFFGDSLTDAGYFRPTLVQLLGPNGALLGQFTTNPGWVWSQYLGDYYGGNAAAAWTGNGTPNPTLAGGDNWAVGGARAGVDAGSALGYIPSLASQYAGYLAAGNTVDPNALYTVWGGANDMFAVQANPSQAQAIIGGAVTAEVGLVGALTQVGARYILVPTLPDLGLTPSARAGGTVGMGQATALATAYNDALFGGLASANLRVIPLDTFHFLQEVAADPAAYGLSNVTEQACRAQPAPAGDSSLFCNPGSIVPGGADSHLFADGVHPTSKAHKALADLAISVIEGPRMLAILPYSASMIGRARANQVAEHRTGRAEADGTSWWGGVRGDNQRYAGGDLYDGTAVSGTFGLDWSRGDLVYGAFAGLGRGKLDFGLNRGDFRQTDTTLGGFVGWYGEHAWVNGQLSYSRVAYDVHREVQLGVATRRHDGSPDGTNLGAGVSAGYEFGEGVAHHGPVASLVAQRIEVDGYAESNSNSTALSYPDQDLDSLVGSVGWQARYAINDHLEPYARLTYDREFEDMPKEVFATVQTLSVAGPYAVPGLEMDRDHGNLRIGARSTLFGLDADMGVNASVEKKGGHDLSAYLTLSGSF